MAYRKVTSSGLEFIKFQVEGDELEGRWMGTFTGKYGENGKVDDGDDKPKAFSMTMGLSELTDVPIGAMVKIIFKSTEPTKSGGTFKQFEVWADTDTVDHVHPRQAAEAKAAPGPGSPIEEAAKSPEGPPPFYASKSPDEVPEDSEDPGAYDNENIPF